MFWISILTGYSLGGLLLWIIIKINKMPKEKTFKRDKYVLERVKLSIQSKVEEGKSIEPSTLKYLIEQWEFDYEMDKLHKNIK